MRVRSLLAVAPDLPRSVSLAVLVLGALGSALAFSWSRDLSLSTSADYSPQTIASAAVASIPPRTAVQSLPDAPVRAATSAGASVAANRAAAIDTDFEPRSEPDSTGASARVADDLQPSPVEIGLSGTDGYGEAASAPVADEVLYITNVGDTIVVTRGAADAAALTAAAPAPQSYTGGKRDETRTALGSDSALDGEGVAVPRPDYEEVYPGCPRVLPQGADEQMALERQRLYGCLYYESCAISEESPPPCSWHLIKKL